jgi:hypothetical protein
VFTEDRRNFLAKSFPLKRTTDFGNLSPPTARTTGAGRQCKERWTKYLCLGITKTEWASQDDQLLEKKVQEIGPRWREIEILLRVHRCQPQESVQRTATGLEHGHQDDIRHPIETEKTKTDLEDAFRDLGWFWDGEEFEWNPDPDDILDRW